MQGVVTPLSNVWWNLGSCKGEPPWNLLLTLMLTLYQKQRRQNGSQTENSSNTKKKGVSVLIKIMQAINSHAKLPDS